MQNAEDRLRFWRSSRAATACRKEAWIDTFAFGISRLNVDPAPGVPFAGALEIVPLDGGSASTAAATMRNIRRTSSDVAVDGDSAAKLMLNTGRGALRCSQKGRDVDFAFGEGLLFDQAEPSDIFATTEATSRVICIRVPRNLMRQQLADFEDRFFVPLPAQTAALSLARAYVEALISQPRSDDARFDRLAMSHLAELVAAALVPLEGAAAEKSAGERAARFMTIEREIDRSFNDPGFSLTMLSRRLGVTPRHVQRLLAANETSFVDEVIERRLRRARTMLTAPRHAHMSIIEISHECGFSTVSHFHRVFRRRFGMTPGEAREHPK